MKKILLAGLVSVFFLGCKSNDTKSKFSLSGEVKNLPDQKVYLEEMYFEDKATEVLDTAEVQKGKFVLSATAAQEGLFKVRFEKSDAIFLVINDKDNLSFTADNNNLSVKTVNINSPANSSLKNFINETNTQISLLNNLESEIKNFQKTPAAASQYNAMQDDYVAKTEGFRKYVFAYVDTCRSATVALFAVGYIANVPGDKLEKTIANLGKRFPGNIAVASVITQFNTTKEKQPQTAPSHIPQPGDMAPEITMPDTEGNLFSLSSLRGKYVLVDFWASWCGPCRGENPNVVKAFNKYKDKNFTVLGVSLDKKKEAWLDAIKTDGLTWKHISDLKQWDSEAQKLYQIEGIPYNVLVDPQGKILATSLRGEELDAKLAEVLK